LRVTTARVSSSSSRASRAILLAVALVLIVSAGLRIYHLSKPAEYIFDEVYYAKDAKTILNGHVGPMGYYKWMPGKEISWPHPEMGKFAIAAGIVVAHNTPLGWRLVPAIAGFLIIALVYPIARRLGLSPEWSLAALVLAAADPLGIAQSRIATLDVFVAFWTVLCIYLTLRYAQTGRRRRWLVLTGLAAGMALGTKWSGALTSVTALALLVALRERPPRADEDRWALDAIADGVRASIWPIVLLVLVPLLIYFASYTQYLASGHLTGPWWNVTSYGQWWELQKQMWTFNLHLNAAHTYASKAGTWLFDVRPVWYYFKEIGGKYYGIVAIGNPLLWWASLVALLTLTGAALRRVMCTAAHVLWWTAVAVLFYSYYTHGIHIHVGSWNTGRDLELSRRFFFWVSVYWTYAALSVIVPLELRRRRPDLHIGSAEIAITTAMTAVALAFWLLLCGALHRYMLGVSAIAVLRIVALAALALWPVLKRPIVFALPTALVALLYLPWFRASRTSFLYYMAPVAPFLAIIVAQSFERWSGARSAADDDVAEGQLTDDVAGASELLLADRRRLTIKISAFSFVTIATTLLWYIVAHAVNRVFWALPHDHLNPGAAYIAAGWVIAVLAVGLGLGLFLKRLRPLRAYFAWGYMGLVAGFAIAIMPLIIDIGTDPATWYHLMWFPSWI
jgi:dolichyl-phosphate-mannose-protein mannosyltransferase